MVWPVFLVAACYLLLIRWVYAGWKGTKEVLSHVADPLPGVTILIPVRNEEDNILTCLQSIKDNDYPKDKYEILLIDDHSTDSTVLKAIDCSISNLKIISLPANKTGKKAAISEGLSMAGFDFVLCTDGDCRAGSQWIKSHASNYYDSRKYLNTATVLPEEDGSILADFQWMDFAMTMAVTSCGISRDLFFLANGANMSYKPSVAAGLKDSRGQEYASGDDIFLVQAMAGKFSGSIGFIKDKQALVTTKAEKTWADFLRQRTRWATKSLMTSDPYVKTIQAFVFFVNLLLVIILVAGIAKPSDFGIYALCFIVLKAAADYFMLRALAGYYGQSGVLRSFFPAFFIYTGYILYAGTMALFPSEYQWKGRQVK